VTGHPLPMLLYEPNSISHANHDLVQAFTVVYRINYIGCDMR